MGLCSDSTSYYRMFGPCLDPSFIPCEEKKQFQFCCILTVFPPIRIESALPPIRIVGVGLRHTKACPHLIMIGGRALPVTNLKTETET